MPHTGLRGPYQLITAGVEANVIHRHPGAYVLGSVENNSFIVNYVGRADSDIAARLKDWVRDRRISRLIRTVK